MSSITYRVVHSLRRFGIRRTLNKVWLNYLYDPLIADYWRLYQFNKFKDRYKHHAIFVAALPKSGSTWLQNMLSDIPGFSSFLPPETHDLLAASLKGKISDFDAWDLPVNIQRYYRYSLAVVRMHTWPSKENITRLQDWGIPCALVYRDLRDVSISWYHYVKDIAPVHPQKNNVKDLDIDSGISFFLREELPKYVDWIRGWRATEGVVRYETRYEKLRESTDHELRRILAGLEIDLTEQTLSSIISRNKMRSKRSGILDSRPSTHRRKGLVGEWGDCFQPHHKDHFKQIAGELLVELGYEKNLTW